MNAKKLLIATVAVSALATGFSLSAQADVGVSINLGFPPPAPYHELAPPPRDGYIWISGYWNWDGHRHVWVGGHWAHARPGYSYHPARWEHREDNHWRFHEGYWREDHRERERHEDREHHR